MVSREDNWQKLDDLSQSLGRDTSNDSPELVVINDHPAVYLPDATFLFDGHYEKVGFDLVITNPDGEVFIVEDYFSFNPPPNLMLASGVGLPPEIVFAKLHLPFGAELMFAGPAGSAAAQIEVGEVTLKLGRVTVRRTNPDTGEIEEVPLLKGSTLYKGDEIITTSGWVKAKMVDDTVFNLGRNAKAILTDYSFDESAGEGKFEAFVERGAFHYRSGKIGTLYGGLRDHSTIKTPSAFIGIRGSELDGNVDPGGFTTVIHRSGFLTITDVNGDNPVVLETPGNTSFITFSGPPSKSDAPTPDQIQQLQENLPPQDAAGDDPEGDQDQGDDESQEDQEAGPEGQGDPDAPGDGESDPDAEGQGEPRGESEEDEPGDDQDDPNDAEDGEDQEPGEGEDDPAAAGGEGGENENREPAAAGGEERGADSPETGNQGTENQGDGQEGTAQAGADEGESQAGQQNDAGEGDSSVTIRTSAFGGNQETDVTGQGDQTGTGTGANDGSASNTGSDNNQGAQGEPNEVAVETDRQQETENDDPVLEELLPDTAPVAVDDTLTVSETGAVEITGLLLANDTDRDEGQTPSVFSIQAQGAQGGTMSLTVNGDVSYTPSEDALDALKADETATESFTYLIRSGELTDSATLTVQLVGSNVAPIAEDDFAETIEDEPISIAALDNDSDDDGDELAIREVTESRGSVIISNGGSTLDYTPPDDLASGEEATDTFVYFVTDGQETTTASVTVALTGRNDPPVVNTDAEPFEVQAVEGPQEIPLSAIFADADLGDELTVVSIDTSGTKSLVTIGSIIVDTGGQFAELAEGEIETDSFFVTVQDQFGATATAQYTFEIVGVNDAPVAVDDSYVGIPGGETFTANVLENDTDIDNGAILFAVLDLDALNGTVALSDDGSFSYTPNEGFEGDDDFVYVLFDEFGGTDSATVTLRVGAANLPPDVLDDQFTVTIGNSLSANVLSNDLDPDDDPITAEVATGPGRGTLLSFASDGSFVYQPNEDQANEGTFTDSFTYTVADEGNRTTEGTATIRVLAFNDPPQIFNPGNLLIPIDQEFELNLYTVFVDPEDADLQFTLSGGNADTFIQDGFLVFSPQNGDEGLVLPLTISASDGENEVVTSFNLEVESDNLPPEALSFVSDVFLFTDESFDLDVGNIFVDPEDDPLVLFTANAPGFTSLSGDVLTIAPGAGDAGDYSVILGANDGQATATTTFSVFIFEVPADDATVAVGGDFVIGQEDFSGSSTTSVTISAVLEVEDDDGFPNADIFAINQQPEFGSASIDPLTGSWTYFAEAPDLELGFDSFTVDVTDQLGNVTPIIIDVLVQPYLDFNPPFVVSGDAESGDQDTDIIGSLVISDFDGNSVLSAFQIDFESGAPLNGNVEINPTTGEWFYVPDLGFTGTDSFDVIFKDFFEFSETFTVTVDVLEVNEPPLITAPNTLSIDEDLPTTPAISIDDPDAGLDPVFVSLFSSVGTLFFSASPAFAFQTGTGRIQGELGAAFSPGDASVFLRVDLSGATFGLPLSTADLTVYQAGNSVSAASLVAGGAAGDDFAVFQVTAPSPDGFAAFDFFEVTVGGLDALGPFGISSSVYASSTDAVGGGTPLGSDPTAEFLTNSIQFEASLEDANVTLANLVFQGRPDETGSGTFSVFVDDQAGSLAATDSATFTVTINAVNDAPVANDDVFTIVTDGVSSSPVPVGANDFDPDGDDFSITQIDGFGVSTGGSVAITGGTVTLQLDGRTLDFQPNSGFDGTSTFTYTISDGLLTDSVTTTLNVVMGGVPQLITPDFDNVIVNSGDSFNLKVGFEDPESDPLAFGLIDFPGWASLTSTNSSSPGVLEVTGTAGPVGSTEVSVTASDGTLTRTESFALDVQAAGDTAVGTNANDRFQGTPGDDVINGDDGFDEIVYRFAQNEYDLSATVTGSDLVIEVDHKPGGESSPVDGRDTLTNIESIVFSDGNYAGTLRIIGSGGPDVVNGTDFDDIIDGNEGADILIGGRGDDQLRGFVVTQSTFGDSFNGDQALDVAVFNGNLADYDITVDNSSVEAYQVTVSDLVGEDGTDVVTGVDQLAFNDQVLELPRFLVGSGGDDTLIGGPEGDLIQGQAGADLLTGDDGDDHIEGGAGNDDLQGGSGDDELDGGPGDDILDGGDGYDLLEGGLGADELTGGPGFDVFYYRAVDGPVGSMQSAYDTITDFFPGEDVIELVGLAGISLDTRGPFTSTFDGDLGSILLAITSDPATQDKLVFFTDGVDGWITINGTGTGSIWYDGFVAKLVGAPTMPTESDFAPTLDIGNTSAAGAPFMTGNFEVGSTLTAEVSGITDVNGLSGVAFNYEWFVDNSSVQGPSTDNTFALDSSAVGAGVSVTVTFTDDGGNAEAISSVTVPVGPQSPQVSGTADFTLSPGFGDFVQGSDGADDITLIGSAEPGDTVDLGDGADTLRLDDGGNTISISNVDVLVGGTGADQVTIFGSQSTTDPGVSSINDLLSGLTAADTLINSAYLTVRDDNISGFAGVFENASGATFDILGQDAVTSNVTLDNFSNNYGRVYLDGDIGASLTINNVTLTNHGDFRSLDNRGGASAAHVFNGNLINQSSGEVDVEHDLIVNGDLDITSGELEMDDAATLTINNGAIALGSGTSVDTDPGTTINFTGVSSLDVDSTYAHHGGRPTLDFSNGQVSVNPYLGSTSTTLLDVLGDGIVDLSDGDSIAIDVTLSGRLGAEGAGNVISGALFMQASGVVEVISTSASGAGDLSLTGNAGFSNPGTILLDNPDASGSGATLDLGSAVTLSNTGEISAKDDDSSTSSPHVLNAVLNNSNGGRVKVETDLDIQGTGTHQNSGLITINSASLSFGGEFTNNSDGTIMAGSTIVADVTNDGVLSVGPQQGTSPKTLIIHGDLNLGSSSNIYVDVFSASPGDHDQLVVDNLADDAVLSTNGGLQLAFADGHGFMGTELISDVVTFNSLGTNAGLSVFHNLGSGIEATAVTGTSNFSVQLSQGYESIFNGGTDNTWENAANWDNAPVPGHDVLIGDTGSFAVTLSSNSDVNSVTVGNGSSLMLDAGQAIWNGSSRVNDGGVLQLNSNSAGAADLQLNGALTVAGTFDWNNGTLDASSTGNLDVLDQLNINIGSGTVLNNVEVQIKGSTRVSSTTTDTLSGLGAAKLSVQGGVLEFAGTPYIDTLTFVESGTLAVEAVGNDVQATFQQNVYNQGLLSIDTISGDHFAEYVQAANTLQNNATIEFGNSGGTSVGGRKLILPDSAGANLVNRGVIRAIDDATIELNNSNFDTDGGRIELYGGKTLTIAGGSSSASRGTIELDGGTHFAGTSTSTSTLALDGYLQVVLNSSITTDYENLLIDSSNADVLYIAASSDFLTIPDGFVFTLTQGDEIHVSVTTEVRGTLNLLDHGTGSIAIQGDLITSGTVQLERTADADADIVINDNYLENWGDFVLNQVGETVVVLDDSGTGTFENNEFLISNESGSQVLPNQLEAKLINNDTVLVNYSLLIDETGSDQAHENHYHIQIGTGATLTLGDNNSLINNESATLKGGGTLDVSGTGVTFTNAGMITPGDVSTSDVFTIAGAGGVTFEESSHIELDLVSGVTPGSGHDQLVFSGSDAITLSGRLRINTVSPYMPSGSYSLITATSLLGAFSFVQGTDLYADQGIVLDVWNDGSTFWAEAASIDIGAEGTPGDDSSSFFALTIGADVAHGFDGDDELLGIGTGDVAFGGEGNDLLQVVSNDFSRVVGGHGADTLQVHFDFNTSTAPAGFQIEQFDVLDLSGGGAQTIELDDSHIRDYVDGHNELTGDENALIVTGDSDDLLVLIGDFVQSGFRSLDIRMTADFDNYQQLTATSPRGSTSVMIGEDLLVEVYRTGGQKDIYGSSAADVITPTSTQTQSTTLADQIYGRDGDDTLDGGSGDDMLDGGDGNDTIVADLADSVLVDGGYGIDTLLIADPGSIDLSGATHLQNFEKISLRNGSTGTDALTITATILDEMIGDNSLETVLNNGRRSIILDGDDNDSLTIDGFTFHDIDNLAALGDWTAPNLATSDNYGIGDGEQYVLFTHTGLDIDIYVHVDLVGIT